jgi:L-threonylcarbamoyladenylate synthase
MPIVNLETAVKIMRDSGVVAFPTETVYGLGALANNQKAIQKVFKVKNRPTDNPLICHFSSIDQILAHGIQFSDVELAIFKHFAPGPCSMLLDLPIGSPLKAATAGQTKIICRIPDHPLALELIYKLSTPIVGPSANTSGRPSCTSAQMVLDDLGDKIDGVLDGLAATIGLESSILKVVGNHVQILRPGKIGEREILAASEKYHLGLDINKSTTIKHVTITTPGAKYSHYSPKTPIIQISTISQISLKSDYTIIGSHESLINFNLSHDLEHNIKILDLGSKNSLESISHDLYYNLTMLDNLDTKLAYLIIENWGQSSIGLALANRLSKVGQ